MIEIFNNYLSSKWKFKKVCYEGFGVIYHKWRVYNNGLGEDEIIYDEYNSPNEADEMVKLLNQCVESPYKGAFLPKIIWISIVGALMLLLSLMMN